MIFHNQSLCPVQITRFVWPTWGPPEANIGPANLAIRVVISYGHWSMRCLLQNSPLIGLITVYMIKADHVYSGWYKTLDLAVPIWFESIAYARSGPHVSLAIISLGMNQMHLWKKCLCSPRVSSDRRYTSPDQMIWVNTFRPYLYQYIYVKKKTTRDYFAQMTSTLQT